jgi:hypothetical protein
VLAATALPVFAAPPTPPTPEDVAPPEDAAPPAEEALLTEVAERPELTELLEAATPLEADPSPGPPGFELSALLHEASKPNVISEAVREKFMSQVYSLPSGARSTRGALTVIFPPRNAPSPSPRRCA